MTRRNLPWPLVVGSWLELGCVLDRNGDGHEAMAGDRDGDGGCHALYDDIMRA